MRMSVENADQSGVFLQLLLLLLQALELRGLIRVRLKRRA